MNEELKIVLSVVANQAKKELETVQTELDELKDKIKQATVQEMELTKIVEQQERQLKNLTKKYQEIVVKQGEESAAAIRCSTQINALTASLAANRTALATNSNTSIRYNASAMASANATGKMRDSHKEATKVVKQSSGELTKAVVAVSNFSKSVIDSSEFIHNYFTKRIEELCIEVEKAEKVYDEMVKTFGAGSEQAKSAEKHWENLVGIIGDFEAQSERIDNDKLNNSLMDLSKTCKAVEVSIGEVIDMEKLMGKQYDITQSKLFKLRNALNNYANKSLKDLKQSFKDARKEAKEATATWDDFTAATEEMGAKSRSILKGLATTLLAMGGAVLALAASTKEYRQQQAMITTAFESAGSSAEVAKQTYNDLYRVLGDHGQATEATQQLGKLTTNTKELAEWTKISQGVYATFGTSLPIEGLAEAVNHSAKLGEVQGTLADALEWSGITVDEFNEQLFWCNSESEREKLIRDTLNGLYADAAVKYEENSQSILEQNEAQLALTDTLATLGETVEPIMTMLTVLATDVMAELAPYIEDFVNDYSPEIKDALKTIGELIGNVLKFIFDNWELLSNLAIVIGAVCVALTLFSTVMAVVNAVMLASPVTWIVLGIVAAITAVGAAIVLVVKYWDEIKEATRKAVDAIVRFVQKVVQWFKDNWQGLALLIVNPFAGAFKLAYDNCEGFRKKVDTFLGKLKDNFKKAINWIKDLFKFEWSLPKIKVPKFSIKPEGWKIGDLLEGIKPTLGITWNARGGVFDRPTIFNYGNTLQGLGEDGAEAVVPLENNTEWLNKIAERLASSLGNNQPTILQVDGKTFAKVVETTVNARTRQTGRLGINIV